MKNKQFVILSMHRSYSSKLTHSLMKDGVVMAHPIGNFLKADSGNPRGYWEDKQILNLNKAVLKAAGGDWRNPPPEEEISKVVPSFLERAHNIVKERNSLYEEWGFKDPRTVLTWDLWKLALTNPTLVCLKRNPMEVAASLLTRNGIPLSEGLKLAEYYNQRITQIWTNDNI